MEGGDSSRNWTVVECKLKYRNISKGYLADFKKLTYRISVVINILRYYIRVKGWIGS